MKQVDLSLPVCLADKAEELRALAEKYPDCMPPAEVAKFLHISRDGLRASIESGKCPFAISWTNKIQSGRAIIDGSFSARIPTFKFYLWYTNNAGYAGFM